MMKVFQSASPQFGWLLGWPGAGLVLLHQAALCPLSAHENQ